MSALGKLGAATFLVAVAAFAVEHRDSDSAGAETGGSASTGGTGGGSGPAAVADIPANYLAYYKAAGGTCPHMDWALLAGIGKIESNHGRSKLPGVHSGTNSALAAGPMQFLRPTFDGVRERHPEIGRDLYDPATAIHATAWKLCDDGVARGKEYQAIFAYNHADWYVAQIRDQAKKYRRAA